MKVYVIEPSNKIVKGCAIVAADSLALAKILYLNADEYNILLWKIAECKIRELYGMEYTGDNVIILDNLFIIE